MSKFEQIPINFSPDSGASDGSAKPDATTDLEQKDKKANEEKVVILNMVSAWLQEGKERERSKEHALSMIFFRGLYGEFKLNSGKHYFSSLLTEAMENDHELEVFEIIKEEVLRRDYKIAKEVDLEIEQLRADKEKRMEAAAKVKSHAEKSHPDD